MVVSLRVWSGNGNTDMTINRDPSKGVSLCVRSGNGNIVRDYLAVEARVLLRMWNRNGNNAAVECDDIFCRFRFACRAGMETPMTDWHCLLVRFCSTYGAGMETCAEWKCPAHGAGIEILKLLEPGRWHAFCSVRGAGMEKILK